MVGEADTCSAANSGATDDGDKCACRATDAQGELLCKDTPSSPTEVCTRFNAFDGTNGGGCSGAGLRDKTRFRCFCENAAGELFCPVAYQFTPPRGCPSEGGMKSHFGTPGAGCSGRYAFYDAATNKEEDRTGSGTLKDCSEEVEERKWESVSGVLEGCLDKG